MDGYNKFFSFCKHKMLNIHTQRGQLRSATGHEQGSTGWPRRTTYWSTPVVCLDPATKKTMCVFLTINRSFAYRHLEHAVVVSIFHPAETSYLDKTMCMFMATCSRTGEGSRAADYTTQETINRQTALKKQLKLREGQ